ncbi:MAG: sensor histidine kinase [Microcoleaceae cyanobacterium]
MNRQVPSWFNTQCQMLLPWLRVRSLGQKIRLGYIIPLGLATLGTWLGVTIGDAQQRKADLLKEDLYKELSLIIDLQTSILEAKEYQHQLTALVNDPVQFQNAYQGFRTYSENALEAWEQLTKSYENPLVEETDEELEIFNTLNRKYDGLLESYQQQINTVVQKIDLSNRTAESVAANQKILLALDYGNHTVSKVNYFFNEIKELVETVREEEQEVDQALRKARRLRVKILTASMLLSLVAATWIAFYISQAISCPLRSATKVAQEVTQEDDFSLQAPVTTDDEVGQLTTALNQLIHRVRNLLDEQERTKTQLVQAEKMSSLGQLVAGVAHEINNPVNFIHGNVAYAEAYTQDLLGLIALYQEYYPDPPKKIQSELEKIELDFLKQDISNLLKSMRVGTERIREIVNSLRNFSRLDESALKAVNIHEGIDSTLLILRNRLKSRSEHPEIKLLKDYGELPLVECYPSQLNQVFMNIISNGIDAIEEWNQQRSLEEVKQHPGHIKIRTEIDDKDWVKVSILNSGREISEQVQARLFDPFFTTKPVGKGTGLGLSISYQIVTEKHHGKIWCNSILGEGTEFVIQVPIQQSTSANRSTQQFQV